MTDGRPQARRPSTLDGLLFIISVALIAHLLFSWMGLIPTDDGFVMAYSRRLLEGEAPHRDFISVRPLASALLYLPFVRLGGGHTFYVARLFVWGEFASFAWLSTLILERLLGISFRRFDRILLALTAFALSAHTFPVMPWFTVDGLFFLSLGLFLATGDSRASQLSGYALVGLSALCKQTFVFAGPAAAVLLGHWRRLPIWISWGAPALLYGMWLLSLGAFEDAVIQMSVHTDLSSKGIVAYLSRPSFAWGIMAGYWLWSNLTRRGKSQFRGAGWDGTRAAVLGGTGLAAGAVAGAVFMEHGRYVGVPSFAVFGAVLGVLLSGRGGRIGRAPLWKAGGLALASAWCASISDGYNTPALASGPLFVFLVAIWMEETLLNLPGGDAGGARRRWGGAILLFFLAASATVGLVAGRRQHVYLERPAGELVQSLDEVFPGAKGIRSSQGAYDFLKDLDEAKRLARRHSARFAILPDLAGYWVKSEEVNPLLTDWSNRTELGSAFLEERAIQNLAAQKGRIAVITQKLEAASVARGPVPPQGRRVLLDYVRQHFEKVGETAFFEVYR